MTNENSAPAGNLPSPALKALILAARGGEALNLMASLGGVRIIDHVLALAERFVAPENTYIVIPRQDSRIHGHLGDAYHYVVQDELRGTGHAVLEAADQLAGYTGDLLILYGDTPLLRTSSVLGMLKRHGLKQAAMTLLTAVTDVDLPYGRVLRTQDGRIIDIVEDDESRHAGDRPHGVGELNLGAYVAQADLLFAALGAIQAGERDRLRLTDVVRYYTRTGEKVAAYRSHDPSEWQGINTAEDLAVAEFTLQKRQFRPNRADESNEIHFGTGGWRAIIGESFTMANVRRLSQALANEVIRTNREAQGVLIGYDRRFLSDRAAAAAAEVFAGNNVPVYRLTEAVPTPLVTFATDAQNAAYGLVFTASHNPPEWNGLKIFRSDGALLLTEETDRLGSEANRLTDRDVARVELDLALADGIVREADFTNAYVDAVEAQIDMDAIRRAGLRVLLDSMYGTGHATLDAVLTEARCRMVTIHDRHDPLFGGRSPAPDLNSLGILIATMKEGNFDLGLAMDGDADRIAIVDHHGEFIHVNQLILLLFYYLHEVKGERGGVVRNLATTHLLDRLANYLGEPCIETPVGFKYITEAMLAYDALLGGESSGGLTIRGHILGKDGILAAALIVEMLAVTGRTLNELLEDIYAITGRLFMLEENLPATSEMKVIVAQRLESDPPDRIAAYPVVELSYMDGYKFLLENDNWLLIRFSGTEPKLRLFVEADSEAKAREVIDWARELISL